MFYQPVVHTATERITGFEALLRWNHPQQGLSRPPGSSRLPRTPA
jgi:EAL domain-containing protein (putative c-di-GMP-specific phosphodiesterase class I)